MLTPVVKDLVIQRLNEKRTKSQAQREIFRNYAAPLAASAEKLVWRFSEIFIDRRYHFLKTGTMPLVYNEYKRKSTLYRIASVLGWLRAINLELSALPRGAAGITDPLAGSIGKFQSALADGPHVEVHRLKQVCAVWKLELTSLKEAQQGSLATRFEVELYKAAGDMLKHDSNYLKDLHIDRQLEVCKLLASFLCRELNRAQIDDGILGEAVKQAVVALSYREALIYRDWQDAIGDAMLELDKESVRHYKIVGYERFEKLLEGESLWMEVFRGSINDIDLEAIDPNDFRLQQLREMASAASSILIYFAESDDRDLVHEAILKNARTLAS